jgi:hypothetical protein
MKALAFTSSTGGFRMQNFTPWASLIGGVFIGFASALYLLAAGRIAGISGLLEGVVRPQNQKSAAMAALFLIGLPIGAALTALVAPSTVPSIELAGSLPLLVAAGFIVGFGARLGHGCTSGHGVCGLPRFSGRSWVATITFMVTAAIAVFVIRHLLR